MKQMSITMKPIAIYYQFMKNIYIKVIQKVNMILTSLIAALGVVGCTQQKAVLKQNNTISDEQTESTAEEIQISQEQQIMCMYGVPRAQYIVHGIVEDGNGSPLSNKEIVLQVGYDKIHILTDESGIFNLNFDGFPVEDMSFEIDGKTYTEKVTYDGESIDAWDRGKATMEVKITLLENKPISTEQRVMVKYGVPLTRQIK